MAEEKKGLPVGVKYPSLFGRTITEGDFSTFVGMMWYLGDAHCDKEFMKKTEFGERIFPGIGTVGVSFGLEGTSGWELEIAKRGYRMVGLMGLENVILRRAVLPGHTLRTETEFINVRPSNSRPGNFVVKRRIRTYNQTGEMVMEAIAVSLAEPLPKR